MRIVNLRTLPNGLIINPDIKSRRSTLHIGKPDWIGQLKQARKRRSSRNFHNLYVSF